MPTNMRDTHLIWPHKWTLNLLESLCLEMATRMVIAVSIIAKNSMELLCKKSVGLYNVVAKP